MRPAKAESLHFSTFLTHKDLKGNTVVGTGILNMLL